MVSTNEIRPWTQPPPRSYVFTNANVVDVAAGNVRGNSTVSIQNGRITSITSDIPVETGDVTIINLQGRYLTPGLIDCHVHLVAVPGSGDLGAAFGNPNDVSVLRQPYVCAQMLHRGFTTVRDCGGATLALKSAVAEGVFPGPRIFIAGRALSQTGGHGDHRAPYDRSQSLCCGDVAEGLLGRLCDGPAECMRAARDELRCGVDFIKIMGSGGVSSPTDRIEQLQFTGEEIRAIVECAKNAKSWVTAHAYTAEAIRHCVENGVRGIEHGNFIDAETASLCAEKGVFLTPTLVTYATMADGKWDGFLPADLAAKNETVLAAGLEGLKIAAEAGVTLCYGTDLLGPLGAAQLGEFALRARVLSPLEILQSATVNAARLLRVEDSLGQVKEGFEADLLVVASNPLQDVTVFDKPEQSVLGIIKQGRIYKSRWDPLVEDVRSQPVV
ncbi:hypothetical protein F5X99DRAFT_416785 [Biscogniauxia marginata]|nr:hypothetical protein F5X99DRAFT_416785 [Biscogniauxia marginata]